MDFDIVKLAQLLNPKRGDASDSEDELDEAGLPKKGPSYLPTRKPTVYAKLPAEEHKIVIDGLDPAAEDALYFGEETAGSSDWRKVPDWDILYKQQVTSSDVFLQMSGKSTATASCEDMIIKIYLPGDDHRNFDLKVTRDYINLVSPKYRLEMPLPHPIDSKCGNAQWDKDTQTLIVTLRINREFDFLNF